MSGETGLQVVARFEREGGIELEGTAEALGRLATLLRRGGADGAHSLTIPTDRAAAPYDGFIAQLRLETTSGRVRIHRDGDTLRIEGSAEALVTLAQNVAFLVSQGGATGSVCDEHRHVHVEYYDNHPFLSQEAEPLTIVLR